MELPSKIPKITLDFENFKFLIGDLDVGHCTELEIKYDVTGWTITAARGSSKSIKKYDRNITDRFLSEKVPYP